MKKKGLILGGIAVIGGALAFITGKKLKKKKLEREAKKNSEELAEKNADEAKSSEDNNEQDSE